MKNKAFIVTLVCALALSLGLAPTSHAIVHPLIVALPLAVAFGAAGVGVKAHKANKNNHDQNIAAEKETIQTPRPQFTGFGTPSAVAK